ncbi:ABC transporter permease [Agromyces indicus]|uniref:ABC transporter permease n=1 Tax=Agromyces indicus TaxID=758919 RepID=A0ABU1FM85_9MICO|nr:ABC transporter permease [Agromyces indicus]MDR5692853.1 ABC transporter permease [Agromyces indicus]
MTGSRPLHGIGTAIAVEARKAVASRALQGITAFLVVGIVVLAVGAAAGAASGDERLAAKLGPLAGAGGWNGLVGVVAQVESAAALLGFGVALSWLVGREFADGTVAGLFALPIRRSTIAVAKLVVYLAWAATVAVLLTGAVAIAGLALGHGVTDAAASLLRIPALAVLTALIATPAAWAATAGRGLLPGIAATVALIAVAQVLAVVGVGGAIPFVAPALWAIEPDAATGWGLALVPVTALAFAGLCARAWSRLQLDR